MLTPRQYYHQYLDSFIDFLVPPGKQALVIKGAKLPSDLTAHEYLVMSDVLGRVADVEDFLRHVAKITAPQGRVIITQYSALWEPILRLASWLGLRRGQIEQNWLSPHDLENFAYLAGFEVVKSGSKMLLPFYLPLLSSFLNRFVSNIFPFSRLGLFHYLVLRPAGQPGLILAPALSIVVPARNEAGTIEKIARELPELGRQTEIIFIEGNSTDKTFEEIERVAKQSFGNKKILYAKQAGRGKGDAVRKGFEMATGDILTIYDADMTVPPEDIAKFYRAIVENRADFINGSRLVYPMQKESMRVLNFFGNKFFSFLFSWIIGEPLKDTLCGTKMLWRQNYQSIKEGRKFFGDFDPFGDFDLLFGAAKLNLKIIDLPVHYRDRIYGTTNISRFSHGWLLLKMVIFAARKIKFI